MFFLVRSAVCIGVVAMMLPDTGPRKLNDVLVGVRSAVPGQAQALLGRVQPKTVPDAAFDLGRIALALASDRGAALAKGTGNGHQPSRNAAMVDRTAAN